MPKRRVRAILLLLLHVDGNFRYSKTTATARRSRVHGGVNIHVRYSNRYSEEPARNALACSPTAITYTFGSERHAGRQIGLRL